MPKLWYKFPMIASENHTKNQLMAIVGGNRFASFVAISIHFTFISSISFYSLNFKHFLLNRSHRSRHHIFFWQIDVNTNATIVWEYIFAIFVIKSRLKWKLLLSCQSIIGIDGKYRCWLVYIYYMRMLTLISTTSCITYNWPWFFHYRIWSIVTTEQYATFNQIERKNDSRI